MQAKLNKPSLRAYKLGLLFMVGFTLAGTQDALFDEVVVRSGETKLQITSDVALASIAPPATPTPTPPRQGYGEQALHPDAYKIDRFLADKGSPMAGLGQVYTEEAYQRGVDPFLMVAISGKESDFGKHACGYNAWGIGNCKWGFRSYQH